MSLYIVIIMENNKQSINQLPSSLMNGNIVVSYITQYRNGRFQFIKKQNPNLPYVSIFIDTHEILK